MAKKSSAGSGHGKGSAKGSGRSSGGGVGGGLKRMGVCLPVYLPDEQQEEAARVAVQHNPANRPVWEMVTDVIRRMLTKAEAAEVEESLSEGPKKEFLAVLTTKYWGQGGVKLPTAFTEPTPSDLQARILAHCNAWSQHCNVQFVPSSLSTAQVRITRDGDGYWSYLGTDVLQIRHPNPTMCLSGFTMQTPETEYKRLVRHEAGHTLGFPHEHMRRAIVTKLDRTKTINFFRTRYGWNASTTIQQVLTPIEESSLLGTDGADIHSIMCYQLPGDCTKDGQPVPGGMDIDAEDAAFAARLYPPVTPPPPPPPPDDGDAETVSLVVANGRLVECRVGNKKVWPVS